MVAFERDQTRFNFRVAGVAIHEGRVLLDRNSRNQYWVLPGGHPEIMETMEDALHREMREETGADAEVVRLLWMMENFYQRKKRIHEISFYFLLNLPPDSPLLHGDGPFYGKEYNHTLTFQWHPLDPAYLSALPLYPGNLCTALMELPETPQHIVFHDKIQSPLRKG